MTSACSGEWWGKAHGHRAYARSLTLTLDGEQREVWVTGLNVDEALRQLGVRADGAFLSVSRTTAIPRSGLAFEVRLSKSVTIVTDGGQRPFSTTAVTVEDALAEAGVALGAADTVAPAAGDRLVDGATLTVTRIRSEREERTVELPYETTRNDDASLASGSERVTQRGRVGLKTQVFDVIYANGQPAGETLVSEETTASRWRRWSRSVPGRRPQVDPCRRRRTG